MTDTPQQRGIAGRVHAYDVLIVGDTITVMRDETVVTRQAVAGLGAFLQGAGDVRFGWGRFPDDAEVIYVYDRADDNFGYALNLSAGWCSEWGYAPFE